MNSADFMKLRQVLDNQCLDILEDRGPKYAGIGEQRDRFANFKLIAELFTNFGVDTATPEGVLAVYMMKHVFSILSYLGNNRNDETRKTVLTSNIPDTRNYLDLLYALIREGISLERFAPQPEK